MINSIQELSANIRQIIQKEFLGKGMKQTELAKTLEMAPPAMNKFLKGKSNVTVPLILNLINKMNVSPAKIFPSKIND